MGEVSSPPPGPSPPVSTLPWGGLLPPGVHSEAVAGTVEACTREPEPRSGRPRRFQPEAVRRLTLAFSLIHLFIYFETILIAKIAQSSDTSPGLS